MKAMQPLVTAHGQVWIHQPCLMTEEVPAADPTLRPHHRCGQEGEWLKVYVEKEESHAMEQHHMERRAGR